MEARALDDEAELIDGLRGGLKIDVIARQLGVSSGAVAMRLARLRRRNGAATNPQLIAVLYDRGVLEPRPPQEEA